MMPAERQQLIERRKTEFPAACERERPGVEFIDFAPPNGRCFHCRRDLVAEYGEKYPTAYITGCPLCHYSYCE